MSGDKIQSLNTAIREAVPEMRQVAANNPNAQVLVRAVKFSSGAQWHIATPTPLENFQWVDLNTSGVTDMGKAFMLVADQLKVPPMDQRGLPPVLVLVSDGYPTDDVNRGLNAIMTEPWGKKAVRLAIGIGGDADYNMLQKFIGNPEIKACHATNPDALAQYIKWASTAAVQASSAPHAQNAGGSNSLGPDLPTIPAPPPVVSGSGPQPKDVW
jgi:uncharacterized protein YegL